MASDPLFRVAVVAPNSEAHLSTLATQLNCSLVPNPTAAVDVDFLLIETDSGLGLLDLSMPTMKPVVVDFSAGKANHRRHFGGGKGQMIAKAVGVSSRFKPDLFDVSAGLGGDAFVLASLGCRVQMFERNPLVHALLADGLRRAELNEDAELASIARRMTLQASDAIDAMQNDSNLPFNPHIIYLDPMFPSRKKSAAVKKEMQYFHHLVGEDNDQEELLSRALQRAQLRVVVKRPRLAEPIAQRAPTYQLLGKTSRYDIYVNKKLPGA